MACPVPFDDVAALEIDEDSKALMVGRYLVILAMCVIS
jgi:hypothetical protein